MTSYKLIANSRLVSIYDNLAGPLGVEGSNGDHSIARLRPAQRMLEVRDGNPKD
jgi:hypothetical protein